MAKRSEIADILVEGMGLEATKTLVRYFGGKQIKIPDGSGRAGVFSQWLDENLGIPAANWLRGTFGGSSITVPMLYDQALCARNRQIVADYDGGLSMLEIIRKYNRTERQIRTILNSPIDGDSFALPVVDDRQLGLF